MSERNFRQMTIYLCIHVYDSSFRIKDGYSDRNRAIDECRCLANKYLVAEESYAEAYWKTEGKRVFSAHYHPKASFEVYEIDLSPSKN